METVFIDGSAGEGGGQILRTSLTLACVTGRNLHIENIRAARRNPGLAKQHLSCVLAACQICDGGCEGAALGSQTLDFRPGRIHGGDYSFDIGSAGSASLVIQTVLPALFLADEPSTVTVTGGTHNPWAPPFDFLSESFLPAIENGGFDADCKLIKHGFFPAGGGRITFAVRPWQEGTGNEIDLCDPDAEERFTAEPAESAEKESRRAGTKISAVSAFPAVNSSRQIHARIYTAKLPDRVAQRQRTLLLQSRLDIANIEHIEATDSDGPGNCVMLRICGARRTTVFTAFGAKGKPSEKVVAEVTDLAESFSGSGAAVDRFLADQLLIYMAIAKTGSYTTSDLSTHLTTNIETIKKFLPVNFTIAHQEKIHRISCASV
ncbi:MAG: RNA 3'-terminal phosphate cyclase [Planctomycetota bacterium]